jgi:PKD repeat protein
MKRLLFFILILLACFGSAQAQGVGINDNGLPPAPSAMLDVNDSTRGVLVSRMTDVQRNSIQNPADGLLIYNITTHCFNFYKNGNWFELCGNCIAPAPPQISSNAPLCTGDTLKLFAGYIPNVSYSWSGPNGFTSSLQNPVIPNAQTGASGTYSCSIISGNCVSQAVTLQLTVSALPTASFTYSPSTVSINQSVTFSPVQSGAQYNWTFQGGTPSVSTQQNPVVSWASGGSYNVSLTVDLNGCTATSSSTVTVSSNPPSSRAFITSTKYNGNLGGLVGADNICQTRANAAGLGGVWKAWLSDGSTSAASRLSQPTGNITAVNGTVIATSWSNLLNYGVHNLKYDEFGNLVSPDPGGSGNGCSWAGGYFLFAWTNTTGNGNVWSSYHCNNWTSTSSSNYGATNYIYNVTTEWSRNFAESCFSCTQMNRLMCFEQ